MTDHKKYFTNGKPNANCTTFWKLTYWGEGGEQSVSFGEDMLIKVTLALEKREMIILNGRRINGNIFRTVEPDFDAFLDWSDDHLLIEDKNGSYQYCLQNRSKQGVRHLAEPIHKKVQETVTRAVNEALEAGTAQQLIAKPVSEIKQLLLT